MQTLRLVELSVERDTPLYVLDALRQIAGNVELVHMDGNRWWLGLVKPNPSQYNRTAPLGEGPGVGARHKKLLLQRQGFRFLGEYTDDQLDSSYLCDELSFMLGRSEKELEADFEAMLKDADYSTNIERRVTQALLERTQADSRSTWAKMAKNRVAVGYQGTPGLQSDLIHVYQR